MDIEFNNASTIDTEGSGWFLGFSEWAKANVPGVLDLRYVPKESRSHSLSMKWMAHPKDDPRGTIKPPSEGRTISILVSEGGRFRLQFSEQPDYTEGTIVEHVLEKHGQFVAWGENIYHRWFVDVACTILTLRWIPELAAADRQAGGSSLNKDVTDLLWGMYQEHTTQGRHHEVQRSSVTTVLAAIAGAIVAFIGNSNNAAIRWPLALLLTVLGLFGAIFAAKQSERARLHIDIAGGYRAELERIANVNLWSVREGIENCHKRGWRFIYQIHLFWFFLLLHLIIAVLGGILLFLALRSPGLTV